ncbi:DUF5671 domain-containing protein [Paracoccus alkanivorans]|uniref:DUF5671 domain-containing protein n=1 Tax=Paracoccus alkanivorans TaxID=2116655 RepID=A0A3M0M2J5_9RHOB|nr:DUF5671 domain-containing protein [Paracoccus alkanivorans]RMC31645.1 hypothetical protein C9E81_20370 [Paracoccus alkanivorans]
MGSSDLLESFVREAIAAGQERAAIAGVLADAGWSDSEIEEALEGWADPNAGMPPVPRPRPYVSARDAILYGLLFISLAVLCWHINQLGFGIIDFLVDDVADRYPGTSSLRWSIAILVPFLPLFLALDRRIYRHTREDPGQKRSLVRRWFASITLLLAVLTLLGDLSATVYAALSGELTFRFVLKAALVAITGLLVLAYYRGEIND